MSPQSQATSQRAVDGPQNASRGVHNCSWSLLHPQERAPQASCVETPAGEDAALQDGRRAPRRLTRESGGRRAARLGGHRRGTAVMPHLRHPLLRIRTVDDNGGGDTGGESQPPGRTYIFPLLVDCISFGRLVAMSSSGTWAWAFDCRSVVSSRRALRRNREMRRSPSGLRF